ncbi:phage tail domain-containing protein [Companilactobacillus bobalius]|uniref:Siphovirus-type tail component RIFT-related domain-containing protein n=2 Tax=Companilactobacillus bobalius TaxID=2801451 RepID=A0A202F3D0_9LACO|nr:phage tail domain-containing protein [Companilactobacillus bobalius]KRK84541.1 hypothetical protein FC78_GL000772 [Companilactobacillus bobalius DSM 19674]OVE94975.1 hypothetical protein LKACC16343_02776 [Companilactobacillus bobalius]GEO59576.1 hypothetical protein LBO01_27050 [Companilactobacillus paralimentarius]
MPKRLSDGHYRQNSLLIKSDGQNEFEISNYHDLIFTRLIVGSPQTAPNLKTNAGVDGQVQTGPVLYTSRTAKADFLLRVDDGIDLESRFHEFYNKFFNRGLVRVRQSYDIGRCFYGIPKPFSYTDVGFYDKTFSVEFDIPSAYMYSVARSTDFPIDPSKEDLISNNLNLSTTDLNYTHSQGTFKIFNPSDFDIQPYEQNHELNIIFKGSGSPSLTNITTQDVFSMNSNIFSNDSLVLKGVHPLLNGDSCEIETNHGHINLKKGWNDFSLAGFSGTVTFDFPFIYL